MKCISLVDRTMRSAKSEIKKGQRIFSFLKVYNKHYAPSVKSPCHPKKRWMKKLETEEMKSRYELSGLKQEMLIISKATHHSTPH